jgi:catechol 2,3-dioxygenase-like lactoylglutathione lyase family enzyme
VADEDSRLPRPAAVRIARRTARLEECRRFYADQLGLPVLASFRDHDGYDGVVLGVPDAAVQLELVSTPEGGPVGEQDEEDALVLYLTADQGGALRDRLVAAGLSLHEPANAYWRALGAVAVRDPEGRSVLVVPDHDGWGGSTGSD